MNHNSWQFISLAALSALSLMASNLPNQAAAIPAAYANAKPSFSDEFAAAPLNKSKWMTTYYWGGRNNGGTGERQYYADNAFNFINGRLMIRATKTAQGGFPYTSGMISSYGKFSQKYGYFEMRAKMPKGKGMWPAFWLLPDTGKWPPEIDIVEFLGHYTTTSYLTLHYINSSGKADGIGSYYAGSPDLTLDYHTYAVDWRPTSITWYVDGVQRFQVTKNIPAEKMYIIANLAVGGNWPGSPDSTTKWPGDFMIEYIRAYPYTGQ